jgi:uroporphyrinogen decarboxylase
MENAFEDFYLFPKETDRLLGALTDWYVEIINAWGQLDQVDAMWMGDDWGSQTALMISREMWRRFFAARYRRLCDEAHRLGLDVHFHSDGNVIDILGDLIDAGVDVIDPVQPEAIDLARVSREFGGKVAFSGGLSDQLLATCSPAQVRDEVHRAIEMLGAPFGNAYILAPSNSLTPEIPLDNLVALFQACHDQ